MAKKTIYLILTALLAFSLSGCIQIHDNKKDLFEGFKLQKKESALQVPDGQKSATVDIHTQIKQCYRNVKCLEGSTFLYHFYASSAEPEQHVKKIIEFYQRPKLGKYEDDKDPFTYRQVMKEYTPRTIKRINGASQLETVSIRIALPLSEYDFNAQSFGYTLPQSVYLLPRVLFENSSRFVFDGGSLDPEYHKVPIFSVNFTNKKTASTLNMAEAEAATLAKISYRGINNNYGYAKKILRHKHVSQGVVGNRYIYLKLIVSLGQRSKATLYDFSEDKKEYTIEATVLQYQLLDEAGTILKTVDL